MGFQVKVAGRIPGKDELRGWLTKVSGSNEQQTGPSI
jgi:hypothetical protein